MRHVQKFKDVLVVAAAAALFLFSSSNAPGQKTNTITATALGTSTQTGQAVSVNLYITKYSTADDQKALIEAFGENGSEGLSNALGKMSSIGRIAITGTLGYDIKYIRIFTMPDGGRKIRFITDRPIDFAERWGSTRPRDHSLSMGEVIVSKAKGKITGTLLPLATFILNDEKHLEIETIQSPWNLINIRIK